MKLGFLWHKAAGEPLRFPSRTIRTIDVSSRVELWYTLQRSVRFNPDDCASRLIFGRYTDRSMRLHVLALLKSQQMAVNSGNFTLQLVFATQAKWSHLTVVNS
jgi:hypothetical protein